MSKYKFIFLMAVLLTLTLTVIVNASSNKQQIAGDLTISQSSTNFDGSTNIFEITGDLTISSDLDAFTQTKTLIIFVDQNLNLNSNIIHADTNSGIVLVVKGDVNIDKAVTQLDAVIISQGKIYTAGGSCSHTLPVPASQLVINGSLVSLNEGNKIEFCRTLSDNSQPAEKINHQVKYLIILRDLMSDTYQKWSEIP